MQANRRELLKLAASMLVASAMPRPMLAASEAARKVILVTCGGIRREESVADREARNLPHISTEIAPHSVFYQWMRNGGVTSHFNTISSILTGRWQHIDDWGKLRPEHPTLFEYLRKEKHWGQEQCWYISSNKAMTSQIGASSSAVYGPEFGANVLFPKQLLINAVVLAAEKGRAVHSTDRSTVAPEMEAMLSADNYDGLGWAVDGANNTIPPAMLQAVQQAIEELVRTNDPVTGDEFTYLVTLEVMRRFAPSFVTISFSDMEAGHFGSYALYQAGIRSVDRLVASLWRQVQVMPAYANKTTLLVLPEFGRDADGSTTNGFFNHLQDADGTRLTWMFAIGEAVRKPQIITSMVEQTQIAPTIARLFDLQNANLQTAVLPGLAL